MDKLSRLEHIIKRLASEGGDESDPNAAAAGHSQKDAEPAQRPTKSEEEDKRALGTASGRSSEVQGEGNSSLDVQFGRLVVNDSMSYYVGNVLWANLANEVWPNGTSAIVS